MLLEGGAGAREEDGPLGEALQEGEAEAPCLDRRRRAHGERGGHRSPRLVLLRDGGGEERGALPAADRGRDARPLHDREAAGGGGEARRRAGRQRGRGEGAVGGVPGGRRWSGPAPLGGGESEGGAAR